MVKHHGWKNTARRVGEWIILCLVVCLWPGFSVGLAGEKDTVVTHLYFSDAGNPFLVAETRVMVNPGDPAVLGRRLIEELISGPAQGNNPTLPKETQLRAFFLLDDGLAVVDFDALFRKNHSGSCRMEQLTLFSIVNTLILNVSEINRVKILIDGGEAQTLAGHLTLDYPLTADMLLTR